jgi:hypothetical protein
MIGTKGGVSYDRAMMMSSKTRRVILYSVGYVHDLAQEYARDNADEAPT